MAYVETMDPPSVRADPAAAGFDSRFIVGAGMFAAAAGSMALVGWNVGEPLLTSIVPGAPTMRPAAAVCFVLVGCALWLRGRYGRTVAVRTTAALLAALVLTIATLSLLEHMLAFDVGMHALLASRTSDADVVRMTPVAAFGLAALSAGLLLRSMEGAAAALLREWLTLGAAWLGSLSVLSYFYGFAGTGDMHDVGSAFSKIAPHTALLLALLGLGLSWSPAGNGVAATAASQHFGGLMLRLALPAAFFMPLALGWLILQGQRRAFYGGGFALALLAAATSAILVFVLWRIGLLLNRIDGERRRIEADLRSRAERLAALVDTAGDAIVMLDAGGHVVQANRATERLFGYRPEQLLGRPLARLLPEFQAPSNAAPPAGANRAGLLEARGRSAAGEAFPVEASITRLEMAGEPYSVVILRDASEHARTRILLERRIGQCATELRQARERALSFDRAGARFLTLAPHELRTPLNGILGLTNALLMQRAGPLTPQQERHLHMVHASGRKLLALINDLLDAAKAASGTLTLACEELVCQGVVDDTVRVLRTQAQARHLAFRVEMPELPVRALANRDALKQVLSRLTDNAIKFTASGSVTIAVRSDDARVRIDVVDTGPGIRAEDLPRLFQPFSQVDSSSTREFAGAGLGLYLCRQVARAMAGDVECASQPGQGSRFTIVLPNAPTMREASSAP